MPTPTTETSRRRPSPIRGRLAPVLEPPAPSDIRRKRPPMLAFLLRRETLRQMLRVVTLSALDFAGIFAAILTALMVKALLRDPDLAWHESLAETRDIVTLAYLVTALLFARSGLYSDRAQRPGLPKILSSLFWATIVVLIFALVNGERFSSYYIFYGSLAAAVAYVGGARWAFDSFTGWLLSRAGYRRRSLLVGTGEHIDGVAHALRDSHDPVELVGFVSLSPRPENGLPRLGDISEVDKVLARHGVEEVIIADPDFPEQHAIELVDQCHRRGVTVRIAPSTMEILVHRAEFVPGSTVPLFELKPPVFEGFDFLLKRTFDCVVSFVLLVVLAPLMIALAMAVAVSSRGGILYKSWRPGIGGEPFACLKFRTMYSDADQRQSDLESLNEATGALFKIRHDPRMTPVGRFLRRYSLDELPQLFNVLAGQMSLVGPRPLPMRDYERLEEWHKKRYLVLPGITGLWQVSGRSELDFDDLVRLDFLYLERWSVGLDFSILLKTLPAVLTRHGAF